MVDSDALPCVLYYIRLDYIVQLLLCSSSVHYGMQVTAVKKRKRNMIYLNVSECTVCCLILIAITIVYTLSTVYNLFICHFLHWLCVCVHTEESCGGPGRFCLRWCFSLSYLW